MSEPALRLTHHALDRYLQRVDPAASIDEINEAFLGGRLQYARPGDIHTAPLTDAWVLIGRAAFPLRYGPDGDLYATTCLLRPRRPKADRRAWRRDQREAQAWA